MKNIKLSLVAALLVAGSSAFAIENTQVSGDANLFYNTDDMGTIDLFDQGNSDGQASVNLSITTDLTKDVKAGARATVINTLGLENNLVSNVWEGGVNTEWWMSEAWMSTTLGKTDVKIGRQTVDTPFVYTENWSIVNNTYDAVLLANKNINNTTLIGAYVGQTNSAAGAGTAFARTTNIGTAQADAFTLDLGAYVAGVVNTSIENVTAQAWYFNVNANSAVEQTGIWAQVDASINALSLGVQYAMRDTDAAGEESSAYGVKAGYKVNNSLNVSAAYTSVDKDGTKGNIQNMTGQQSKLYTDAVWNFGYVGRAGADSYNVTAELDAKIANVAVNYTNSDQNVVNTDMQEIAVSVSRSYGALDTTVAYINTDAEDQNAGKDYNSARVYLTYNF